MRKERASQALSLELTGQQFGDLTVLHRTSDPSTNGGNQWLCQCSCGRLYQTSASLLATGRRTHCNDMVAHPKHYAFSDITGQRFQYLLALYPLPQRNTKGMILWHCRCDCGNEINIPYNELVYSNRVSCGCRKKIHEEQLHQFLTHVAGTSMEMLKSAKLPKDNTTGCKGVYRIRGKYVAKIVFQKRAYYLGTYDNFEDAALARKQAETNIFGCVADYYAKWKIKADADPSWGEQNPIRISIDKSIPNHPTATCLPEIP